jgi:glutaredoxin
LDEREQETKKEEIYEQIGYVSFPYVKINGRIIVGYKPTEYEKSLTQ